MFITFTFFGNLHCDCMYKPRETKRISHKTDTMYDRKQQRQKPVCNVVLSKRFFNKNRTDIFAGRTYCIATDYVCLLPATSTTTQTECKYDDRDKTRTKQHRNDDYRIV